MYFRLNRFFNIFLVSTFLLNSIPSLFSASDKMTKEEQLLGIVKNGAYTYDTVKSVQSLIQGGVDLRCIKGESWKQLCSYAQGFDVPRSPRYKIIELLLNHNARFKQEDIYFTEESYPCYLDDSYKELGGFMVTPNERKDKLPIVKLFVDSGLILTQPYNNTGKRVIDHVSSSCQTSVKAANQEAISLRILTAHINQLAKANQATREKLIDQFNNQYPLRHGEVHELYRQQLRDSYAKKMIARDEPQDVLIGCQHETVTSDFDYKLYLQKVRNLHKKKLSAFQQSPIVLLEKITRQEPQALLTAKELKRITSRSNPDDISQTVFHIVLNNSAARRILEMPRLQALLKTEGQQFCSRINPNQTIIQSVNDRETMNDVPSMEWLDAQSAKNRRSTTFRRTIEQ